MQKSAPVISDVTKVIPGTIPVESATLTVFADEAASDVVTTFVYKVIGSTGAYLATDI